MSDTTPIAGSPPPEPAPAAEPGANPSLPVRGLDTTGQQPTGCGSGKTLADDLDFEDAGGGPTVEAPALQ
jgi:hypothetical protein